MPLVSVVIPAYNSARTLEDCVRSVCAQTAADWEIVIVDDGSADGTAALSRGFGREDARIRLISQGNAGTAAARARGVKESRGRWIAFLDADDRWLPEKLEAQLSLAGRTGAELLYTAAACIDPAGNETGRIFSAPPAIDFDRLLRGNAIVCSSVLIKREWAERFPMEHAELHEDYLCWLRVLRAGCLARGVTAPLTQYRISPSSKSGNKLRSAAMTWRTLRTAGVPFARRCGCFLSYAAHGIRRYH